MFTRGYPWCLPSFICPRSSSAGAPSSSASASAALAAFARALEAEDFAPRGELSETEGCSSTGESMHHGASANVGEFVSPKPMGFMVDLLISTLWWTNILPWKITIFNGKIHYKWPFSIAMLAHQRVKLMVFKPPCVWENHRNQRKMMISPGKVGIQWHLLLIYGS